MALHPVRLETYTPFEGFEGIVLCSVVSLDLFIVVCSMSQPVMWHLTNYWRWLTLITATNDLDTPVFEPAKEGLKYRPGHSTDLVPNNHMRDVLLAHPFRGPLSLATPPEEAVISLGLDPPSSHLFCQTMCRGEDQGVSDTEELNRSRGFATSSATIQIAQLMP